MDISTYLDAIRNVYATGVASEHSYRPALRDLFASIDDDLDVVNEPKKVEVGAPDFIFQRDGIARGWCEHKDIDKDIVKPKGYSKEQKERYCQGLPNLIYTNGLDFEFIRDGEAVAFVTIADFTHGLPANPDQFSRLETLLREFAAAKPISIKSAKRLAELMAGKAKLIKQALDGVLKADPDLQSELANQFKSFKANLLPNLTAGEFADIYAETITYGMFAARFHDLTPNDFSRAEALELLPKSNPFLRSMFQFVAGYDLDERIAWIVDDLAELLQAANVHDLFADYGKWDARNDPFIHFYEDFLGAYNPKKRKSRGVWYTPEPVVDFIVRAVDDVLKSEFGLSDGLADTSKVSVDWDTGETDKKGKPVTLKKDVHRVQILDPATGTGTFLAKAAQLISTRVKKAAPSAWSSYVEKDLLPRLHGFELLMASYAMCHMKLDMQLTESGYVPSANPPRLSVWLTNALEPAERVKSDLFWTPLAKEAEGAADVKRQSPIMCVIGNPPYSAVSQNKGKWISNLIEDYKYVDGKHFNERKHWLQDDYVKFIRMSEDLITKNPSGGILGFITNHGYLDNPTFRGMRWHLLKTFDKIYVLDLHGNSKKSEVCPDGSPDKNVFDIMQGVAIIIGVKKRDSDDGLAEVWHGDLWGSRKVKNGALWSADNLTPVKLPNVAPSYPFVERDFEFESEYKKGFLITNLICENVTGIVTMGDKFIITKSKNELEGNLDYLLTSDCTEEELKQKFSLGKNYAKWIIDNRDKLEINKSKFTKISYRPFDEQWTYFDNKLLWRWREKIMRHLFYFNNISIQLTRQKKSHGEYGNIFAHDNIAESSFVSSKTSEIGTSFPLYLYPEEESLDQSIRLNFDPKLYNAIREKAGLSDTPFNGDNAGFRDSSGDARPDEIKVFDYIYGVLHCPEYRETYKEFLKIDFPRIPYPASPKSFAAISAQGEALRRLHLMEDTAIGDTPYPFDGAAPEDQNEEQDSVVDKPRFMPAPSKEAVRAEPVEAHDKPNTVHAEPVEAGTARSEDPSTSSGRTGLVTGRVYINGKGKSGQYFDNVPLVAWEFYIGGYQPAQKWLKDRKGRALSFDDLRHYQKIIKILMETDRIMESIKMPMEKK